LDRLYSGFPFTRLHFYPQPISDFPPPISDFENFYPLLLPTSHLNLCLLRKRSPEGEGPPA